MSVAEAPAATSITLRVATVRGAALVEMNTSSTGVSMLPKKHQPRAIGGEGGIHLLHGF